MNLNQTLATLLNEPGDYGYWCLQFDNAVAYFGNTIERWLYITDKDHKPKYTIEQLLSDEKPKRATMRELNAWLMR